MNHRRIYILAISLFCLILGFASFTALWGGFWADSEIWATATSRLLMARPQDFDFLSKPLFHFALWFADLILPYHHPDDGANLIGSLMRSRILMMINLAAILTSVVWIARALGKSWIAGTLAPAILIASTFFFEQAHRIRSDLLSVPFVLWAIHFSLLGRPLAATTLILLAFWITPKTALLTVFLLPMAWRTKTRPRAATVLALILMFVIILQGRELGRAFEHFLNEGLENQMGFSYFASIRWNYILNAIEIDPWFWGLFGIMIPIWISSIWRTHSVIRWEAVTLIALIALALNPSKLPFLIASYLPIFVVAISVTLSRGVESRLSWLARLPTWQQIIWILLPTLALSLVMGTLLVQRRNLKPEFSNQDQIWLTHELSTYAQGFPQASLYDGIGLLTDRELSSFFIGPGQREQNSQFLEYLKSTKPSWILETQKVILLQGRIAAYLDENYVDSPSGLWRKAVQIKFSNQAELKKDILNQLHSQFPFEIYANSRLYFVAKNSDGKAVASPWQKLSTTSIDDFAKNPNIKLPDLPKEDRIFVTPYPPFQSGFNGSFINAFRFQR